MQVSPSVRAVQVPETNPMHPQFTTIYLVGRGQVLTIDSGDDEERYRWMLRGYLAATEKAEIGQAALTHFHFDHSSNIRWLCDEFGAQAYVSRETAARLDGRLPLAREGHRRRRRAEPRRQRAAAGAAHARPQPGLPLLLPRGRGRAVHRRHDPRRARRRP